MKRKFFGLAVLGASVFAGVSAAYGQTWQPPIGIPAPSFGISESVPAAPNPWTTPTAGFYYVEWSNPLATDSGNPYGTPALPRKTIPLSLPAGSVVELHGTYDQSQTSPRGITCNGTAASPVFIRGSSLSDKPRIRRFWEIKGTYFILENLEFTNLDGVSTGKLFILSRTDHAALRNSDVHGNLNNGGVRVTSLTADSTEHVVIYNNLIHDNGDVAASFDQDVHGIAVGARVNNLWVVDNLIYRNSGDGIQISAGSLANQPTTHHIYVGRNTAHHNKQTGFWTKQATDVIFSQNLTHGHRPGNSSYGACMGFQYAPERVWFLFNHAHDCDFGIGGSSDSGLGSGQDSYFIGNVIHNIHHHGAYNPGTAWSNAAIMLAGGVNRYIIHNTIHDVDAGINSPGSSGALHIANNILSGITESQGNHIFIEMGPTASASTMNYNLMNGTVRIKWGSATVWSLPNFQAAFPGQGGGCMNADPLFMQPSSAQFRVQAASPALDAGTISSVYSTFLTLYGVDISKDTDGVARPLGPAYDVGAFEGAPPAAPTGLRIVY